MPFALRYPALVPAAYRRKLAANIDIAPTIYELSEKRADTVDGFSWYPSKGETTPGARAFLEAWPDRAIGHPSTPNNMYIETDNDLLSFTISR